MEPFHLLAPDQGSGSEVVCAGSESVNETNETRRSTVEMYAYSIRNSIHTFVRIH